MKNSTYMTILGTILLVVLYFNLDALVYALVAMTLLEGVSGWTIPTMLSRGKGAPSPVDCGGSVSSSGELTLRDTFGAQRVLRLVMGVLLLATFLLSDTVLWFFPWFMGFAILGAGVSNVCPMLIAIKWIGFK